MAVQQQYSKVAAWQYSSSKVVDSMAEWWCGSTVAGCTLSTVHYTAGCTLQAVYYTLYTALYTELYTVLYTTYYILYYLLYCIRYYYYYYLDN